MKKQLLVLTHLIALSAFASDGDKNPKKFSALQSIVISSNHSILHEVVRDWCKKNNMKNMEEVPEDTKKRICDIVQFGFDINTPEVQRPYYTPLHIATQYNAVPLVTFLLTTLKADINICNNSTPSPLMIACENRNQAMIQLLLGYGAKPQYGYLKTLSSLQKGGYRPPVSYITPLMEACHANCDNAPIINLLLQYGANRKEIFTYVATHQFDNSSFQYKCFFEIVQEVSFHNAATIIGHLNTLSPESKNALEKHIEKEKQRIAPTDSQKF